MDDDDDHDILDEILHDDNYKIDTELRDNICREGYDNNEDEDFLLCRNDDENDTTRDDEQNDKQSTSIQEDFSQVDPPTDNACPSVETTPVNREDDRISANPTASSKIIRLKRTLETLDDKSDEGHSKMRQTIPDISLDEVVLNADGKERVEKFIKKSVQQNGLQGRTNMKDLRDKIKKKESVGQSIPTLISTNPQNVQKPPLLVQPLPAKRMCLHHDVPLVTSYAHARSSVQRITGIQPLLTPQSPAVKKIHVNPHFQRQQAPLIRPQHESQWRQPHRQQNTVSAILNVNNFRETGQNPMRNPRPFVMEPRQRMLAAQKPLFQMDHIRHPQRMESPEMFMPNYHVIRPTQSSQQPRPLQSSQLFRPPHQLPHARMMVRQGHPRGISQPQMRPIMNETFQRSPMPQGMMMRQPLPMPKTPIILPPIQPVPTIRPIILNYSRPMHPASTFMHPQRMMAPHERFSSFRPMRFEY